MSFAELMNEIKDMHVLPDMAIRELPGVLEEKTKKRLCKAGPEKAARILKEAIDEVDAGAVDRVDTLVRKKLGRRLFFWRR